MIFKDDQVLAGRNFIGVRIVFMRYMLCNALNKPAVTYPGHNWLKRNRLKTIVLSLQLQTVWPIDSVQLPLKWYSVMDKQVGVMIIYHAVICVM